MGNSIARLLQNTDVLYGGRVRTFSTTVIQVLGQTGLDYVYLDLEHAGFSPYDSEKLEQQAMVASEAGLGLVVRTPSTDPSIIRTVLDAGVQTVLLPRVKQASEVERAVRASQFHYDGGPGERGFGTSPSNDWGVRPDGYTHTADEQVLVGIMLETEEALQNVEEILSVPELGFAKIGVGDLSVSLGSPQMYEDDDIQSAISTFRKQCEKNNVILATGVSEISDAEDAADNGYRLIDVGGDIGVLRTTFQQRIDRLRSR